MKIFFAIVIGACCINGNECTELHAGDTCIPPERVAIDCDVIRRETHYQSLREVIGPRLYVEQGVWIERQCL